MRTGARKICLMVAGTAAAGAIVAGFLQPAEFFRAYLFASLACLHPTMGCLLLLFIHRMTGGAWGQTLGPVLEAGSRIIGWMLIFCVPLSFGLSDLYPWAAPDAFSEPIRALLAKHAFYYNQPAVITRWISLATVFMFLRWIAVGRQRAAAWTGPVGMIVYVVGAYLFAVDSLLALEPGWTSTGFPVIVMASQALTALAAAIAATIFFGSEPGTGASWRDIGNLLLGTLMFWTYVAYSQFLVVWAGNLPKESGWYVHRNAGGWHWLLIALAAGQLFIPVVLLLGNRIKRRSWFFGALAAGVFVGQTVYLYWLIMPSFYPAGIEFHWLDGLLLLALGSLLAFSYLGALIVPKSSGGVYV